MELAGEGRVIKRFRVAREGQTVDGRELLRKEIQQMADSYDPEYYAGRINVEHIIGFSPAPPFQAYGDIIKVEAVEENHQMCLYATISALPNFIKMNKDGQKIYPSIEFYRNFAGTGKAYLVGLGMTDTPNSLGTQAIKFSNHQYAVRTQPDVEIFMSNTAPNDQSNPAPEDTKGLLAQIKEMLTPQVRKDDALDEDFKATISSGVVSCLNGIRDLNQKFSQISKPSPAPAQTPVTPAQPAAAPESNAAQSNELEQFKQLLEPIQQGLSKLQNDLSTLSTTPVNNPPPQSGGDADIIDF